MKKILATALITSTLLMTACNGKEDVVVKDKIEETNEEQTKTENPIEKSEENKNVEIKEDMKEVEEEEEEEKETAEEEKEEEMKNEEDSSKEEEIKEEQEKEKDTTPTGKYETKRMYNSKIHIYITGEDETVNVTLGKKGELEHMKDLNLPNTVAKINLGLFDNTFEQGGMLYIDGKYIQPPTNRYSEIIKYKDGRIKIESFKVEEFDKKYLEENKDEIEFIIGGSYPLIKEGEINLGNAVEYSHYNQRNPRTMFGQLQDGRYVLVVVEGRSLKSAGVTAEQSAEIMKDLGAVEAINLDGGGSSMMYIGEELKNSIPGSERKIGSALLVTKK